MLDRFVHIEMALARCEKTIDELNEVVIGQGKKIDALTKQCLDLKESLSQTTVKDVSEEVPPPHY